MTEGGAASSQLPAAAAQQEQQPAAAAAEAGQGGGWLARVGAWLDALARKHGKHHHHHHHHSPPPPAGPPSYMPPGGFPYMPAAPPAESTAGYPSGPSTPPYQAVTYATDAQPVDQAGGDDALDKKHHKKHAPPAYPYMPAGPPGGYPMGPPSGGGDAGKQLEKKHPAPGYPYQPAGPPGLGVNWPGWPDPYPRPDQPGGDDKGEPATRSMQGRSVGSRQVPCHHQHPRGSACTAAQPLTPARCLYLAVEMPFTSGTVVSISSPALNRSCEVDPATSILQCNKDTSSTAGSGFLVIGEQYITNKASGAHAWAACSTWR